MRRRAPTIADAALVASVAALAKPIGDTLQMGVGAVAALLGMYWLAVALGGFAAAGAPRLVPLARVASIVAALATALAAASTGPLGLGVLLMVAGLGRGAGGVVSSITAGRLTWAGAAIVAVPMALVLTERAGLTWRAVLLVCAGLAAAAAAATPATLEEAAPVGPRLGTSEGIRSVLRARSVPWLLAGLGATGGVTAPLLPFLLWYFEDRWPMREGGRALLAGALLVLCAALPAMFTVAADLTHGRGWLRRLAGLMIGGGLALGGGLLSPAVGPMVVGIGAGIGALLLAQGSLADGVVRLARPDQRSHAAALATAATVLPGAAALMTVGPLVENIGLVGALALVATGPITGALFLLGAARHIRQDLRTMAGAVHERAERRAGGEPVALLACRELGFSYDARTALDGISLDIARGEAIAVLGTNGAGKTTLLKTISGLHLPDRGTIRLAGEDITWLDPERRAGLGIAHVVGGRSTFGDLTVRESLLLCAHTRGMQGPAAELAAAGALTWLPELATRTEHVAALLSDGERHLLGLAQALMLRPRLLLIDELSMNLAPAAIDRLVATLRELNASGVTLLIADQSIEVALALASRAFFLDQGRVVFAGTADELRARPDLLRSLYLAGPAEALA